jgi:photosystem II stability/assembly factor-like uncharacterized protein
MKKLASIFWIWVGSILCSWAQVGQIESLHAGGKVSIRGLSVVNDEVAWVSGSGGWVGKTLNQGSSWEWMQVIEREDADFRDIEAFSDQEAVILSAGSPLLILRTEDGGLSWDTCYRDDRKEIFFDGMSFWDDQKGIAFGDPIDGLLQLVVTEDGGKTWKDISQEVQFQLAEGEAGFAASGTGIRTAPGGKVWIGTGGSQSRLLIGQDYGRKWKSQPTPMQQGTSSTGIFSLAVHKNGHILIVGGDYMQDNRPEKAFFTTTDFGATWETAQQSTRGFRSGIEILNERWVISTGTSGVDISQDGGTTWKALSDEGYHVVRKAKQGTWVVLAGGNGRIAQWVPTP